MSKPSSVGVQGSRVTFSLGGRNYVTASILPANAASLSLKQAEELVANGQAWPVDKNYLAQFPWTTPPK